MIAKTRDEKSLLLYLEARAVDFGAIIDGRQMNDDDEAILARWVRTGFVETGRIRADKDPVSGAIRLRRWVRLSPAAVQEAHAERAARIDRVWESRAWATTQEGAGGE